MANPPANPRPRTVLYVAASETAASDGAATLEGIRSEPKRSVHAVTTVDRVRNWAPEADCVVFAETPTTTAGSNLLEIVEASDATPLVLFSDASYAPAAARSTDGIDGYVRRDTDDAVAHLADEIEWLCSGVEKTVGSETEADSEAGTVPETETESEAETASEAETEFETEPDPDTDVIVMAGERATPDRQPSDELLESVPELVACRDRDRLFERLIETAADALERDYCWLSTVHFGDIAPRTTAPAVPADALEALSRSGPLGDVLRTGEPLRIDHLTTDDRLPAPLDGVESLCCVPMGDVGIIQVAAEEPAAFDERDRSLLVAWGRVGATILERLDADASDRTERERLRRERNRLRTERDRLAAERDELSAERDRFQSLFANVPEPAVRYEIDAGEPIVRTVNDTFTEVFGTDPGAIVGTPLGESTVPLGLEKRRATLLEALRAGERRQLVSRRETVDGVREFLLTLVPLAANVAGDSGSDDADYNPEGVIVYSDVTEHNRRERELAATEARLETIAELVDDEVRTPLNVARGYLEIAEETGDREYFAAVDDAQERLRELVDRLVAIARRDDVLVETEPVAIHDVARRAWIAVDTGDVRLVTRAAENRVLEADKTRLRELFEHLFQAVVDDHETAAARTEPGAASIGADGSTAVVTVGATDDGFTVVRRDPDSKVVDGGLEAEPVPGRLAAADGTGFGLGRVERIADAHGWNVGVVEDGDRIAFAFRGVDAGDEE